MDTIKVKLREDSFRAYKVDGSEETADFFVSKYSCEKVSDPLHPEVYWVKLPTGTQVLSGSYIVEEPSGLVSYNPTEFKEKYSVQNSTAWRKTLRNYS